MKFISIIALFGMALAAPAELLTNGGFESGTYAVDAVKFSTEIGHLYYEDNGGGTKGLSTPDGWTRVGSATRGWLMMDGDLGSMNPTTHGEMAYRLDALVLDSGLSQGGLSLVAGRIYKVTVDLWSVAKTATGGDASLIINFTGTNIEAFGATGLVDDAGSSATGAIRSLTVMVTAPDTGVYTIELYAAPSVDTSNSPFIDNVSMEVSTYSLWAAGLGLSGVPTDDYDGDHMSDFYEYALNGDPKDSGDIGRIEYGVDGTFFEYIHYKRTDDDSLVYTVQDTTNLVSGLYNSNAADSILSGASGVPNFDLVTNRYDMTSKNMNFIQVSIDFLGDGISGLVPNLTGVTTTTLNAYPNTSVFTSLPTSVDSLNKLWFQYPATHFTGALPIGNGGFAAMVFGGLTEDVIQFNHENLWEAPNFSDDFLTGTLPSITNEIADMRDKIFNDLPYEAHQVARNDVLIPHSIGSYQPFALLEFDYDYGVVSSGDIEGYQRVLDMETGVASSRFVKGSTTYDREVFIANDKNVIALHMTATGPDRISTQITLTRPAHYLYQVLPTESCGTNEICIYGKVQGDVVSSHATRIEAVARVIVADGTVTSSNGVLTVSNTSDMTVLIAGETDFNIDDPYAPLSLDLRQVCRDMIDAFETNGWAQSKTDAIAAHQPAFNRVDLRLGPVQPNNIPTEDRVKTAQTASPGSYDLQLDAQLFQFGRYMTIASSRPGSLPVNLEGKWCSRLRPAWDSDYHHDINIQMSYWHAEVANLSEYHRPYFDMMERMVPGGERVATDMFGNRGTFLPLLHGGYLTSLPGQPARGLWAMAGPWGCSHIMEHYRFGGDQTYLQDHGFPLMAEHVLFCLDWLVSHPVSGELVAGPDWSPEHSFALDAADATAKRWGEEDMGPAMSQQLVWQLFTDYLEAATILGVSNSITDEVETALPQLALTQISPATGRIQEWSEDYYDADPYHRHVSHLFAFYPGYQYTDSTAPAMVAAAKQSIVERVASTDPTKGPQSITWSTMWVSSLYARFGMATEAYDFMRNFHTRKGFSPNMMGSQGYVQDANWGYVAWVVEMLMQSHDGEIVLLPSLPSTWPEGEVSGIVARGGFEISMTWDNGVLTDASILSKLGNDCTVRYGATSVPLTLGVGQSQNLNAALGL